MTSKQTVWEYKQLSSLGSFSKGAGISKADLVPQGVPCIRYAEIYTKYNFQLRKCLSHIPAELTSQSAPIVYGNILFAGSGETAEDIGKSVAYLGEETAYASGDIIIFTLNDKKATTPLFLAYYLNTIGRKQLNRLGEGQSIVHIYPEELSKVSVPFPSTEEQHKIVEVLETWNKAIQLTRKLIEQKELQKKYLMQQLLTGRTRLKGFTGKWIPCKLGDICSITTGKLDANAMVHTGKYRFFTCSKDVFFIDKFAFDTEALLISGNGNIGYVHYYKGKFNAYQRTYVLDAFSKNILFTKYMLELMLPKRLARETKAGSMPYIVLSTLSDMLLLYPAPQEQNRISEILQNADREIDLFRQKLAKLEEQKKGLMQVLLTGKVRLKI